jgi:hypothetical protein
VAIFFPDSVPPKQLQIKNRFQLFMSLIFLTLRFQSMIRKILLHQFIWMFVFCCASTASLHGQTNNPTINIQGILKNTSDKTVDDGEYTVTFKLYPARTGSASIWQEQATVNVVGGIYSHNLGSVMPLDAMAFATTVYLGVRLNGYELSPLTELTYAPYVFTVNTAQTVYCSGALGDIKYSILNPTQFAAVNGDCWVPMDGKTLAPTSALRVLTGRTTLPDGGGVAIRAQEFSGGQNNDVDRTAASPIATLQSSSIAYHDHAIGTAGAHKHDYRRYYLRDGGVPNSLSTPNYGVAQNNDQKRIVVGGAYNRVVGSGTHSHSAPSEGVVNTQQKNLNFWVYIRVN